MSVKHLLSTIYGRQSTPILPPNDISRPFLLLMPILDAEAFSVGGEIVLQGDGVRVAYEVTGTGGPTEESFSFSYDIKYKTIDDVVFLGAKRVFYDGVEYLGLEWNPELDVNISEIYYFGDHHDRSGLHTYRFVSLETELDPDTTIEVESVKNLGDIRRITVGLQGGESKPILDPDGEPLDDSQGYTINLMAAEDTSMAVTRCVLWHTDNGWVVWSVSKRSMYLTVEIDDNTKIPTIRNLTGSTPYTAIAFIEPIEIPENTTAVPEFLGLEALVGVDSEGLLINHDDASGPRRVWDSSKMKFENGALMVKESGVWMPASTASGGDSNSVGIAVAMSLVFGG